MLPRERGFPSGSRMNHTDTCKRGIVSAAKQRNERERRSIMRLALKTTVQVCLISLLLVFSTPVSRAQAPAVASGTTARTVGEQVAATKIEPAATDTRYRIGPGDVLEIRVARAPELSRDAVRVDQGGNIRMPMLDIDIPAACQTEGELSQNIARLYRKYKNDPHVDVFVKEFQSQPVAVIGAIHGAAQFKMQRPDQMLELLTFAGGPTGSARQTVQIVHAGGRPFLLLSHGSLATNHDAS